ncbi:MAG: type II toxin-antitoxin system VapC family toxin [Hyphomonadaceae bacterium]
MIVADASAVLAILLYEPERQHFIDRLTDAGRVIISPVNYWEVLARALSTDGQAGLERAEDVLKSFGIEIVPVDADAARIAADAFARFGKRTPAALNLGDCFAYALAKQRGAPLLYKGGDFAKTDVAAA